jgi:hypothetical protein
MAVGTVRNTRRHLPAQAKEKHDKMERGTTKIQQDRLRPFLSWTTWKDTKPVSFLSTCTDPKIFGVCTRRVCGELKQFRIPSAAVEYNKSYGYLDRFDQLKSAYRVGNSSKKAWKHLCMFLINASIVNAFILYSQNANKPAQVKRYDQFQFRLELGKQLVGRFNGRKRPGSTTVIPREGELHSNTHMRSPRVRRCVYHKFLFPEKPKHETSYGCKTCGVFLCKACHKHFHDQPRC